MRKVILLLGFLLTSCGSRNTPESAVKGFFGEIKAFNLVECQDYLVKNEHLNVLDYASRSKDSAELYKSLWNKMEVEVGKSHNGLQGSTVVPVRISSVDVSEILRDKLAHPNSDHSLLGIIDSIKSDAAPKSEATIELEMYQEDGKWRFFPNGELNQKLMGGLPDMSGMQQ